MGEAKRRAEAMEADEAQTVPLTETPEFKEAVAQVRAQVHAEFTALTDAFKQARGEPAVDGDVQSMFRQMAMAIAEISDQDQGRKRIPPDELAKRAKARSLMDEAIARARRKVAEYRAETGDRKAFGPDAPNYLFVGKCYLGEELVEPFNVNPATKKPYPVIRTWVDVPNEAMRPVNDSAKEIFRYFTESIGGQTEVVVRQNQVWLSAGGNVVMGEHGVPVRREAPDPLALADEFQNHLGPGQFDPRRDKINVLGTISEPARHVAMGVEPRKGI